MTDLERLKAARDAARATMLADRAAAIAEQETPR